MIEPKNFYQVYLKDYHKVKATYLIRLLEDEGDLEAQIYGSKLDIEQRNKLKMVLKADLRQTYFHAIETFFELYFALNPKGKKVLDDELILFTLTNSKWVKNYEEIQNIADNDKALDFLDEQIEFLGQSVSIGHYLFYVCISPTIRVPEGLASELVESIEAIKYGIRVLACDFSKKEEYNAYKHGLRIIPATKNVTFVNAKTMAKTISWDLSDSMSFYLKSKNQNEVTLLTKLYDPKRDYAMITFCSNLIHNLIYFRELLYFKSNTEIKDDHLPIPIFSKEAINKCATLNVEIQDLVYSVKRPKA